MKRNKFNVIAVLFSVLMINAISFHVFAEDTAGDYVPEGYVYTQDANYIDLNDVILMSDEELSRLALEPLSWGEILHAGKYVELFEPQTYYYANPDLKEAIGMDPAGLYRHFARYGMQEGRYEQLSLWYLYCIYLYEFQRRSSTL